MSLSSNRLAFVFILLAAAPGARGQEPLHARIDAAIRAAHVGPLAGPSGDAEFLRRASLSLTGTIPTSDEAREFLDDPSPGKRAALIDRLLDSPRYARHIANVFDVMLMERRPDKNVSRDEWEKYLFASFSANKPYNQLAREILAADGVDPHPRAPAKFYLDREVEPNLLTRDVGRMFFGMDLQCAQCHDHPLIEDYQQSDYYGIFAFLNRSYAFAQKDKKVVVAEKGEGDVNFKSVFTGDSADTRPRLPGEEQLEEPVFPKGEEYEVKPAKDVRPVPKYSRRARLAEAATAEGGNRAFNRNMVNRLWALMMGRGLVDPVDLHHADNAASQPQLLDVLADEFVAMKYDVKALLREIALTETYQRSFDMPSGLAEAARLAAEELQAFEAAKAQLEQAVAQQQQQREQLAAQLADSLKQTEPVRQEMAQADKASAESAQAAKAAEEALRAARAELESRRDVHQAVADAADKTAEAAKKLAGEADLASAAEQFRTRATQLAAKLTEAEAVVQQAQTKAQSAAATLAAAEETRMEIRIRFADADKAIAELKSRLAEAATKTAAERAGLEIAGRRVADAQKLAEYGSLMSKAETSRDSAESIGEKLAARTPVVEQLSAALPRHQESLAAVEKQDAEARAALEPAQSTHDGKQEAVKLVTEVVAKLEAARAKLPDDAELGKEADKVKARLATLSGELPASQKQLTLCQRTASETAARLVAARDAVETASRQLAEGKQAVSELQSQLAAARDAARTDQARLDEAHAALVDRWTRSIGVRALEPLTPEQLAWSVMRSTGVVAQQEAAAGAELEKKADKAAEGAGGESPRAWQIEQAVYEKLKGNVAQFVKLFGAGAGQPQDGFFATVDQALFFANGGQIRGWLNPGGGNLTDRLIKLQDDRARLAEELYLSVLTRRPRQEEVAEVDAYLKAREGDQRSAAVQQLAWALLTSAEFRFNH